MRAFVTGGTGFLGMRAAQRLQQLGWEVTAAGRNEQIGERLRRMGIRFAKLDLRDHERVLQAAESQDVILHCAALSSAWGRYEDFYNHNVVATEHLIDAALRSQVQRFVHISTPSVYFNYIDRLHVPEESVLPARFVNPYAGTKYIAECKVLEAAEKGLPAVILRPRALFGPEDPALFPRLMRLNRKGGIPLIDGGRAVIDLTYVDNVVESMIRSIEAPDSVYGHVFNISNGEPVRFIDAVNRLFVKLGEEPRFRPVPYPLVSGVAAGVEFVYRLLRLPGEPPFTRYTIGVVSRSQTLDITKAERMLGYKPIVTLEEGFERFAAWWKERRLEESNHE